MGFPRQAYWRGLPFSSPGNLPDPKIEPGYLALQTDSLPAELPGEAWQAVTNSSRKNEMLGQSRNDAQLWMCLVVKVRSDTR